MKGRFIFRTLSVMTIILSLLTSCQKEISDTVGNIVPVPPPVSDSNYLSAMYIIVSDGSVTDTTEVFKYFYDNAKRVTSVTDSEFVSHALTGTFNRQYFYNGADTLPFKMININQEFDPQLNIDIIDTTTTFFYYDATGKLIKDSTIQLTTNTVPQQYEIRNSIWNYQYSGNNLFGYRLDTISTFSSSGTNHSGYIERDTATLDANGNLVSNRRVDYNSITGAVIYTINSTVTYDDKPSPYARLSNFKTYALFPFGETFFNEMPQKNNRLHIIEVNSNSGTYDEDLTGKYSYRSNGFPSQILIPDGTTPGAFEKVIFVYTSL